MRKFSIKICAAMFGVSLIASSLVAADDLPPLPLPPPPLGTEGDTGEVAPAGEIPAGEIPTGEIPAALPISPGEETAITEVAAVPATTGIPGRIFGGRVNIRAGNSTRYEIIVTASVDTPVTVYGKDGDWVKIGYPDGQYCYMSQGFVDGAVPPDIPDLGLLRTVRGERVALRARPWPGSTVVGYVSSPETVTITGLRGRYVRIKPPATAYAWVFGKYVKYEGTVGETAATENGETTDGKTAEPGKKKTLTEVVALSKEQREQNEKKMAFYRQLADRERRARQAYREDVDSAVADLNADLKKIEEDSELEKAALLEKARKLAESGKADPNVPVGYFSGWVEYVGKVGKRPAAYRLMQDGRPIMLLRSAKYDLTDHQYKRVIVRGMIEPADDAEADVLRIDELYPYGKRIDTPRPIHTTPPTPVESAVTKIKTSPELVAPVEKPAEDDGVKITPVKVEPPVEDYESRYER